MPLMLFRIIPCSVCEKEILTVVAEVGIEAEGSTVKFQSLSAAQGRVTDTMIRSVAESTIKWRAKITMMNLT
jgi:hypothetical protein